MAKWRTGVFKGRGVAGTVKYGKSSGGFDQVGVVLRVAQGGGQSREGTVYIVLTDDTIDWAIERLRCLGWKGTDIRKLDGIDRNYVDVEVSYREVEERAGGDMKDQLQLDILVPARVIMKKEMTKTELDSFADRIAKRAAAIPEVAFKPLSSTPAEGTNARPVSPADLPPNHPDHPDHGA
jgi:hypothetical protein